MYQAWFPLLASINWIRWPSFLLRIFETCANGRYSTVILVPASSFFYKDVIGINTITSIDRYILASTTVITSSDHSAAVPDPRTYPRHLWKRSVLFLDTLRERADNMIAQDE